MSLHVLNSELTRLLQQTAKQFGNSFQPRPKRGRRQRRGLAGKGSEATVDDIRGISYATIPKATGTTTGPVTPGVGLVKLYDIPTGPAGTPWAIQADPVTAENWMEDPVVANKPIFLRKSRVLADGTQIYVVSSEGCKPRTSG